MTETVFALIYSALLSSRSPGTCMSPRSTVKVVVDCMRDRPAHVLNVAEYQNWAGSRREVDLERARKNGVKRAVPAAITSVKLSARINHPLWSTQFQHLQRSHYPYVGVHHSCVRSNHTASSPPQSDPDEILRSFRAGMEDLSSESGRMDRAWDAFERLRTSDTLPILPDDDLLEFVAQASKASLLSLESPVVVSKEFAAHLGRLHDEVLRRADNAPDNSPFQVWQKTLAVQTLLWAGKSDKVTQMVNKAFAESKEQFARHHIGSLEQLFTVSVLQKNLELGLSVLAVVWPAVQQCFNWYQPIQHEDDAERLRRTVLFAFRGITDSNDLVNGIKDQAALEVGASLLAYNLCALAPWDKIRATHRDFFTCKLPMSVELRMQFFKSALAAKEYPSAYRIRNHIFADFLRDPPWWDIDDALRSFPEVSSEDKSRDALAWKAECMAMERFASCIKDPWKRRSDLLSIWEDVTTTKCHRKWRDDGKPFMLDYDIRVFAKIVIDNSCAKLGDLVVPNAKEAISALSGICNILKERYARKTEDTSIMMNPLVWHIMILQGELPTVRDQVLKERKGHLPDRTRTMTQVFLAAVRLQSLPEAFELLVPLWGTLLRHLDDASGRFTTRESNEQGKNVRGAIFGAFGSIENPAAWIAKSFTTPEPQEKAVHMFFLLFREYEEHDKAIQLLNDLQVGSLPFGFHSHMVLLKMLIPNHIDVANRVHRSLCKKFPEKLSVPGHRDKDELHVGLRLFSLQGNVAKAEEYYHILRLRGEEDKGVRRRRLRAHAVNGDTQQARRLFAEFFSSTVNTPTSRDFREIIYAHVRAGDLQGIQLWLDQMLQKKIKPDIGVFNIILLALATSLDLDSAMAVLQRMRDSKTSPNARSYSTVMSIMSENKDPIAAEQLYVRAVQEGVVPDDIMIFTLMNAHVEAGSWKGVIRAFDYLQQAKREARLNTQLYNVLLKAYVLIGAPFDTVSNVFKRFAALKLQPSERTYALLIQSACDAGRMDTARELFAHLETLAARDDGKSYISVYAMTIIMAGFLRKGEKEMARAVYEDMAKRGIQPTAITFSVIISSYANERSQESLQTASDFIQSLFSAEETQRAWIGSARGGRPRALDAVFSPLMHIYGREMDVTAVEKFYDEMLAAGGQPTLINLTILMDAYRRVTNLEGVQHVWGEIVAFAKQLAQNDPFWQLAPVGGRPALMPGEDGRPQPRQANILCLPLSVYIAALSAQGEHLAIARTWREVKELGFTFDAHNWNHLACALVRAGEVERAFEIVERVILPYQRQAFSFVRERRGTTSPLTFVEPEAAEAEAAETGAEFPLRPGPRSRRQDAVKGAEARVADLTLLAEGDDGDPVQQLHELQQLSLTWQAWRPHAGTLDLLNTAMRRLEAGLRVRPEGEAERAEEALLRMDEAEALEAREAEKLEVGAMVVRIYSKYSQTLQVMEQRQSELDSRWKDEEERSRSYS